MGNKKVEREGERELEKAEVGGKRREITGICLKEREGQMQKRERERTEGERAATKGSVLALLSLRTRRPIAGLIGRSEGSSELETGARAVHVQAAAPDPGGGRRRLSAASWVTPAGGGSRVSTPRAWQTPSAKPLHTCNARSSHCPGCTPQTQPAGQDGARAPTDADVQSCWEWL